LLLLLCRWLRRLYHGGSSGGRLVVRGDDGGLMAAGYGIFYQLLGW
jgi:hypothetical protein